MKIDTTPQILGVSLGMLIIDEIRMPNKPPLRNIIGGSSTFVTLGLRLFASDPSSVGCLILAGSDFPPSVEDEVKAWKTTLVLQKDATKRSSRGQLVYEDTTFGPKTFEYTTPPIRATPDHLSNTPLLRARTFHFFGRPEEILAQVPELLHLRHCHDPSLPRPLIVWEPLPSSCHPSALTTFLSACKLVDVFSPNHLELAALFNDAESRGKPTPFPEVAPTLPHLTSLGAVFVDAGIGPHSSGTVVVRAGADGAFALAKSASAATTPGHVHVQVPAFYALGSGEVVDATGAGNAFLGGYMAGWLRAMERGNPSLHDQSRDDVRDDGRLRQVLRGALCCGAVAASFALEQIGLPGVERVDSAVGQRRLVEFVARLEMEEQKRRKVGVE
ncbi:hypothetical protein EKO04_009863 [Ascochyta lentis]|uniref:Carbohydrate kinase PfkB domain-containing protein n=1 Tax=Ascochyta lentis TaxID=205686 RepID=A0A8H7IT05_9PLEO|nr:hypothetical protein EKO04_009863 [Ascochyta lentis]